jgi:hypothetical protein
LIKACLASIPTYLLSVIKFPKWAINVIYSQIANFFWGDLDDQHKYHLADWGLITRKKKFGGLGVPNLRDMNLCLLGSWFKRFFSAEDKIWRKIIEYKYNTSPNICWISSNATSSPFWKGLTWAAPSIRSSYHWKVGNGKNVLFWLDTLMSGGSLVTLFWDLFSICNEPSAKVSDILVDGEIRLSFRRCFDTNMMCRWRELCALLGFVSLSRDRDTPIWSLETSREYSVRFFYNLVSVRIPYLTSIWKLYMFLDRSVRHVLDRIIN